MDASPWGGGAVRLENGVAVETFALTWSQEDEKRTGAKISDAGSQALWEAYMALRCLWQWMKPSFVRIRGDAQGVLSAFIKGCSSTPLLNNVVKEVTLILAKHFTALQAVHVWSEANTWADELFRGTCPPELPALPTVMHSQTQWHEW